MLLSKTAKVKWNPRNKSYYVGLGYRFTYMSDEFDVDVFDLSTGSNTKVSIQCDYCGSQYEKRWTKYIAENEKSVIHKDCCLSCRKLKIVESVRYTYGVNSVLSLSGIQDKIAKTNEEKYGATNPFSVDIIKEKIRETNERKYGESSPLRNKDILKKMSDTCLERYGVKYFVETQVYRGEKNSRWEGGVSRERSERFTTEYVDWRNQVFCRDKYTCQCCGGKNGFGKTVKLNAHHILNWGDYPDYRFDIENGITLCEQCHIQFHKNYGKSLNNQTQLDLFISNYGKKLC